jgi:hypothetical protein
MLDYSVSRKDETLLAESWCIVHQFRFRWFSYSLENYSVGPTFSGSRRWLDGEGGCGEQEHERDK